MSCKRHKYTLTYMLRVASLAERMGKLKASWNLSSVTWWPDQGGDKWATCWEVWPQGLLRWTGLVTISQAYCLLPGVTKGLGTPPTGFAFRLRGSDAHPDGLLAHCFHRRPCFINRLQRELASVNVWKGMLAWVSPLLVSAGTQSPEVKGEGVLFSLFSTCPTSLSPFFFCNSQIEEELRCLLSLLKQKQIPNWLKTDFKLKIIFPAPSTPPSFVKMNMNCRLGLRQWAFCTGLRLEETAQLCYAAPRSLVKKNSNLWNFQLLAWGFSTMAAATKCCSHKLKI